MDVQGDLLAEIMAFLKETGMTENAFSEKAMGDWKFIRHLRERKSMTTKRIARARTFIRQYPRNVTDAAQ